MKNFAVLTLSVLFAVSAQADKMYGVFMVVKGSVKVESAGKTSDAKVGTKIYEGDGVTTAADSRAKIVMSDRNVLNVSPDTKMSIAKYENDAASGKKNVELKLDAGKVRSNVEQTYDGEKSKFQIKTPTAVAGVRGTQFLAGFDSKTQSTSIVTFKGSVTLTTMGPGGKPIGAPVIVNRGETTSAAADKAPEAPKAMPKEEMKKAEGESAVGLKSNEGGAGASREVASEKGPGSSMVDKTDTNPLIADGPKPPPKPPEPPKIIAPPTTAKLPVFVPKTQIVVKPKIQ